jgi:hypothetical protein
MEKSIIFPMILNLQLFAEGAGGADGGTGAEGASGVSATAAASQTKGAKANTLANVKYGIQEEATTPAAEVEPVETEDRNARFEALIKGEFKDLYDAKMQDTVQKRLKGSKENEAKLKALTPILEMLGKKYGEDASNIEALIKAIEEDDSYYEEEALEKGISVQQLKEFRKVERENADLKRQMEEQNRKENANKLYAKWMSEAESTKAIYPSFDLNTEMQNPKFIDLLRSNIDVRTAFEVLHKDEIIPAAMQYTAKTVEQKLTNKMIANGARPVENGNSSQSAAITKSDVSQLSREDRAEINRRVARGEKITFSRH